MSGLMSVTGHPETGPTRAGFAVCDAIAGMTAAFAVSSALYQRTHTGQGQFVDVAMLDAALAFIPGPVTEWLVAGIEQKQIGNGSVSRKPTANRFRARDSYLVLAVLTEPQFQRLMKTIGRGDALDDPRFKDWAVRCGRSSKPRSRATTPRRGRRSSPPPTCRARPSGRSTRS
jgi:crotonobetainyl-CoA:carnitine CoA-transferase CaiB-like acyl-CoA transferase